MHALHSNSGRTFAFVTMPSDSSDSYAAEANVELASGYALKGMFRLDGQTSSARLIRTKYLCNRIEGLGTYITRPCRVNRGRRQSKSWLVKEGRSSERNFREG
ncbi:hypothetical protein EVAR_102799_1 [Eumeta japonica]|uniref:Uncharacterized protein n=1 Tax=Eumeta variegata TaxID=151549 RepID=A0A4C1TLD8_EUMVA|nr:hypothetical protein EVAR_102799_1 [Eumeta japonica]